MTDKKVALMVAASLTGVLMQQSVSAHGVGKGNDGFVVDSSGHLVSDGAGDCLRTREWSKDLDLVDCGAEPKKTAVVAPEPAPTTQPAPMPEPVAVSESVALSAGALFDVNSDQLKDAGKQELSALATHIKALQEIQSIKIIGHTDSTGAASYNQVLSQRRANAVKNYLLDQGISPTVMSTLGMGEERPVASNATREGRAQNRRVEIKIEGSRKR